jgi:hypothetical protein
MKTVIQVNQKHNGQHPVLLLEVNKPTPNIRKTLRLYTDFNQANVEKGSTQRAVYLGGKFGGFILD